MAIIYRDIKNILLCSCISQDAEPDSKMTSSISNTLHTYILY